MVFGGSPTQNPAFPGGQFPVQVPGMISLSSALKMLGGVQSIIANSKGTALSARAPGIKALAFSGNPQQDFVALRDAIADTTLGAGDVTGGTTNLWLDVAAFLGEAGVL